MAPASICEANVLASNLWLREFLGFVIKTLAALIDQVAFRVEPVLRIMVEDKVGLQADRPMISIFIGNVILLVDELDIQTSNLLCVL